MVLRHPAWLVPIGLLSLGLAPTEARVLPPLVLGRSFSPRLEDGASRDQPQGGGSSLSQRATALRLGGVGQFHLISGGKYCRGAWGLNVASRLRGGAAAAGDDTSEDEDSDESFGEDDDDEDDFEDEDFGEASFVGRLVQDWKKTPVITRTFFQVSVGIAVLAAVLNDNQWPSFLLLDWEPAILKLQLWRLFTPFLYLGPLGLNFMLTTHFSWTYMSQLEKLHYREPHTFVMLLAFGVGSLLLLTLATGADINSSYTLGHSLSCFLVMVWSRKFAGSRVNVLEMFELSTELLPYFFVAQTLMMEGVIPWVDLSGLLIGYAWETLSIKGLLKAPKPLVNLFRNNAFLRAEYARAGKDYGQELPPLHDDDDEDAPAPTLDVAATETEEEEDQTGAGEDKVAAAVAAAAVAERRGKDGGTAQSVDEGEMTEGGGAGRGGGERAEPKPVQEEDEEEDDGEEEGESSEGGEEEEDNDSVDGEGEVSDESGEESWVEESDNGEQAGAEEFEQDTDGEVEAESEEDDFSGSFEQSTEDEDSFDA